MHVRSLLGLALVLLSSMAYAQFNTPGRVHLSIGGALGGHGTTLEQRFTLLGLELAQQRTGGAATLTVPIELGVGIGGRFSLGLGIEPGRYVPDSSSTVEQSNAISVVTLQPRFYLVNADRFAWTATLQVGAAGLRIKDETPGRTVDERYAGPAFGFGSGVAVGLGNNVALEFHLRYLATRMELQGREFNGASTMQVYKATLSSGGVLGQLSLSFRFGGK